jgi:hypothetical protein
METWPVGEWILCAAEHTIAKRRTHLQQRNVCRYRERQEGLGG